MDFRFWITEDFGFQISHFGFQWISDFEFQIRIPDFGRFQMLPIEILDFRFQILDFRFWNSDFRFWISADLRFRIFNFGFQILDF